jgi:hypothetical protein
VCGGIDSQVVWSSHALSLREKTPAKPSADIAPDAT